MKVEVLRREKSFVSLLCVWDMHESRVETRIKIEWSQKSALVA